MDSAITGMTGRPDGDLMLCPIGIAYQVGGRAIDYGAEYLDKIEAYDPAIAMRVNAGRCALLARHLHEGWSVLDVGAGDGAFIRAARSWGFDAKGYDVITAARDRLAQAGLYDDDPALYDAVTAWDVIEHLEDPALTLRRVSRGALLFLSLPIFEDLTQIRRSKHYRPNEHLLYFTRDGLVQWIAQYGFELLEESDHEVRAGRESIGAFAFRRSGGTTA